MDIESLTQARQQDFLFWTTTRAASSTFDRSQADRFRLVVVTTKWATIFAAADASST